MKKIIRQLVFPDRKNSGNLFLIVLLSTCTTGNYRAPVVDQSTQVNSSGPLIVLSNQDSIAGASAGVVDNSTQAIPSTANPSTVRTGRHVVSRGETLYSIAWLYGVDFRRIAIVNGLNSPFTIYPGQELKLNVEMVSADAVQSISNGNSNSSNSSRNTATSSSRSRTGLIRSSIPKVQNTSVTWRWPSDGRILGSYGKGGGQGVNIAGQLGQRIVAAGDGEVVYAGRSIQGAGDLIIIRHNDRLLSAYANNSAMLVSEGVKIKAGEAIAEIGSDLDGREHLHFEIRLEGKPVDPLGYLPKR